MTALRHHTSAPDRWTHPRPTRDLANARHIYGPLQPMEPPSLWQRIRRLWQ